MKYIYACLWLVLSSMANAGVCGSASGLFPYEAKGLSNAMLFYSFRENQPDYRFAVRIENDVEFVPNFQDDRRALIDGNFYQFLEQDVSPLKLPSDISEKSVLDEYKKTIIGEVKNTGANVIEEPICSLPASNHNFIAWKLDIKNNGETSGVTQLYVATLLNDQIVTLSTGIPLGEDISKLEKSIFYYVKTFQLIESQKDCPSL